MKKKFFKKNRGVTLIELIVYVTLFSTVVPYMFQAFQQVSAVRERALILNESVTSCVFATFIFAEETRQAAAFRQPNRFGLPAEYRLNTTRTDGSRANMKMRQERLVHVIPGGAGRDDITSSLLTMDDLDFVKNGTSDFETTVTANFDCIPSSVRFGDVIEPIPFETTTSRRIGVGAQS